MSWSCPLSCSSGIERLQSVHGRSGESWLRPTDVILRLSLVHLPRFFDVSKQVIGQMFVHGLNVLISDVLAHVSAGNACVLYFLNILIDTTLGECLWSGRFGCANSLFKVLQSFTSSYILLHGSSLKSAISPALHLANTEHHSPSASGPDKPPFTSSQYCQ